MIPKVAGEWGARAKYFLEKYSLPQVIHNIRNVN